MRYFVTGGTGLIGRELVSRLLERGGEVRLLVRSRERHAELIEAWRAEADAHGASLRLVDGDVTQERLGIEDGSAVDVDHVFHLAAIYDLEADDAALHDVNVGGTQRLIALLHDRGFRGTLHHVSSIAVAGDFSGSFKEAMLEEGQRLDHAYHRSKHESEKRVREITEHPVRIYRPGAVVGHSVTGEALRADGPYYLFKPIQKLARGLPRWMPLVGPKGAPLHMVPVDYVAAAIDHLAHCEGLDGQTFHVVDPEPPSFRRSFNIIADVAGAPRLKRNLLRPLLGSSPAAQVFGQLGSVKAFRKWIYEDAGIPPVVADLLNADVRYDTTNLLAGLEGSDIECPPQEEYVEALWDYWKRHLDPTRDVEGRRREALEGKVVMVTGGSSGIGEAFAHIAAGYGAVVVLVARRQEELDRVVAAIREKGGSAEANRADLTVMDECDEAVRATLERHGKVDILINNAGRSIRRDIADSLERFHDLERVMQINYFGPARLIRGCLPAMRKSGGTIVNVLSAGTNMPSPRFGAYTASKAALGQLGNTLAAEHAHEDVHVANIYLPWVRTPMMDATGKYDDTRAMSPEKACDWILEGIVDRKRLVFDQEIMRRFVWSIVAPRFMTRITNVVNRIYADDPKAHPELGLDRAMFKKFVKGRMI